MSRCFCVDHNRRCLRYPWTVIILNYFYPFSFFFFTTFVVSLVVTIVCNIIISSRLPITNNFCVWKLMHNVEEDGMKSPGSSSTSPQLAFVSSKPPPDSSNNDVGSASKVVTAEEESSPPSPPTMTNGKSSPPVNGVAPVRHENGSNKNLSVEIDIPPGTRPSWLGLFLTALFLTLR